MNHRLILLLALASVFLAGCSRSENSSPPAPAGTSATSGTPGDRDAGKRAYLRVCFVCHQPTGIGVPGAFPPLAGSPIVAADPDRLIRIVLFGLQGPVEVNGTAFNGVMPPQGAQLKDAEIADVLTYVRSAWGNDAPAVTLEAVGKIRAAVKRDTPWTWAELNAP
jgi:mono/diheme cytochrome c family protein